MKNPSAYTRSFPALRMTHRMLYDETIFPFILLLPAPRRAVPTLESGLLANDRRSGDRPSERPSRALSLKVRRSTATGRRSDRKRLGDIWKRWKRITPFC